MPRDGRVAEHGIYRLTRSMRRQRDNEPSCFFPQLSEILAKSNGRTRFSLPKMIDLFDARPLTLTREQIDLKMATADVVAPCWKDRFPVSSPTVPSALTGSLDADIAAVADTVRVTLIVGVRK